MSNIDVEIYMSQFINFFETNPNDLIDLIGDLNKQEFYDLVKIQCEKNKSQGDDVTLTQDQIIDIVIKLKKVDVKNSKMVVIVDKVFQSTKFGLIGLN
jgi:hypothetical protein